MELPAGLQEVVVTTPLTLAFLALIAATLLVFFAAPVFFRSLKKVKIHPRLEVVKRHPRRTLAAAMVILIVIFAGYVYYYFNQPVRIVSAAQFKIEKSSSIEGLQQTGLGAWKSAGLYLLDIRSRKEYATEHLKGSESLPATRAIKEKYPLEKIPLAIYSSESKFEEAREVAEAIKKNGDSAKNKYKEEFGTIYVIKGGYEALKAAGLATESGIWD